MKSILMVIILLPVIINAQIEWEWQDPYPQGNDLYSIMTIDSLTTLAGGKYSTIIRTTDAGLTWKIVYFENDESRIVRHLAFAGGICFALIDSNIILKSTDHGNRWERLPLNIELRCNVLSSVNTTLWLGCKDNSLLKSTDLGITWQTMKLDSIQKVNTIFFWNDSLGWVTGAGKHCYIFKTTNGGKEWKNVWTQSSMTSKMRFADANIGWQTTYSSFYRTFDGGKTWREDNPGYGSYNDFIFITPRKGFVSNISGTIYSTENGGETWSPKYPEVYNWKQLGFVFSSFSNMSAYAAGADGALLKIDKNEQEWKELNNRYKNMFTSIHVSSETGLAASYYSSGLSTVFITTNSGERWSKLYSFGQNEIRKVYIISDNTFIAAGRSIYKSVDGGTTWIKKIDSEGYIYSLFFSSAVKGFAGGLGGKLFKTTDGGETWSRQAINTSLGILSIHFFDENNGWLAGEYGILFRTTDGGESWSEILSPSFSTLTSIHFINSSIGFTAGDKVYKTTDAGSSWVTLLEPEQYIQVMKFTSNKTGYIAGDKGFLYKTTNWGSSWIKQEIPNKEKIWDMFLLNEELAWICGEGMIMRNSGTVLTSQQEAEIVYDYSLYQNYPNPFNPSTTINYSLAEKTNVEMIVYDILGKKVTTLVNEEKPAGEYSVDFNAVNLASGVYYYQLKTNNFTLTKKMILIR